MSKNKNGWDRSLGTSKKEQGIETAPPPRYKKFSNGKLKCKCLFRGKELWQKCFFHIYQEHQQKKLDELIVKIRKENEEKDKLRKEAENGGGNNRTENKV